MTRRFWIAAAIGAPVFILAMADMFGVFRGWHTTVLLGGTRCRRAADDGDQLDRSHLFDAGRALGRLAVLRARVGVHQDAPAQHVHAHRARHRRGLALQRRRDAGAAGLPGRLPRARRGRDLLRYRGRDHGPRAPRPDPRAAGARPHGRRDPAAARPRAANGAHHPQRPGARRAGRAHPAGRSPARPARGEDSDRRARRRGPEHRRRVDAHGRAAAGRQGAGTAGHGRDHQRHGQLRHARGARRERDRAGADRPDGGRGAAHARSDSAAGRCRVGLVRAGGGRRGDRGLRGLVCLRDRSRGSRSRCSVPSPCSSSPAPARSGSPRRWRSWWARAGARPPAC